jgi:hypothetical protein
MFDIWTGEPIAKNRMAELYYAKRKYDKWINICVISGNLLGVNEIFAPLHS